MSDKDYTNNEEEEIVEGTVEDTTKEEKKDKDKKDDDEYEKVCTICHRPESTAGKMVDLPNNITVCNDCMQRSFDAMTSGQYDLSQLLNNPNVQIFNMGDMEEQIPKKQKLKKKKEAADVVPLVDINNLPAPHKIKANLDEYIIGQEHAKKAMSVAVYNHYKRVATNTMDDIEIEKSNMLMIGPTGSGKTYLVKTLAKLLDVPLAITDATSLTEAGYIGDDIESVVSKLLAAADNDVEKAEQGIIFIDEIDKIAKKKNSSQRDVSGESVQQGMLKLLEGSDVEVPVGANSKNAMVPLTTINTRNILFICGGAFPDLDGIIQERLMKQSAIGFGADLKDKYKEDPNILDKVTLEDLRNFGMIPEFLGRLPVVVTLQGLGEEMLVSILKEPKNAILKQYQKLLALDEVQLEFNDEALHAIAKRAMKRDTGARALRAIIEEFMLDIMYEIPKDDNIGKVTITKEYIEGTGGPIIKLRTQNVESIATKGKSENE
ncbi:MAG TPA: ATP-dependent Clp protease ATP-binding subunit ClpX [Candidatus Dorea intestinavium]|nr:ATP-dependent Clp protease ATP-binding subunit ClpX [Candidatus Dorea intestinavium]